ncbi:hypothetical protein ESZ53_06030 [Salinibacterium sp. UTAS2018]|uniref:hypothetical protein n=1 Tax=Salinibacterium sp. UTAS2018 TaxID=2508880 RepID=UPI00100944D6|nr:hypothetical protein [Salinibacterium sp. UTAS2018]QAV70030.1 hypothetical protein ESZ53_06030 [Salinibacterium sp. UTAS2018]
MTNERTEAQQKTRRLIAIILVVLLGLAAVVAIVLSLVSASSNSGSTEPTDSASGTETSPAEATADPGDPRGEVVDSTVTEQGLVAQPITDDMREYAIEAAKALVTVDSTKVDRTQFKEYIAGWVGYDQRYGTELSELESVRSDRLNEIYNRLIGDTSRWDLLARDNSVIVGAFADDLKVDYDHATFDDGSLDDLIAVDLHTITVGLEITTTADQSGNSLEITDPLSVSMQIQCKGSYPVPPTTQAPGDCTVIRYFPEFFN